MHAPLLPGVEPRTARKEAMVMSKPPRGQTLFGIGTLVGLAAFRAFRTRRYELAGRTVFVSGGSRGLGLLLAHEFAARGMKVAISGRDQDALDRATDDLRRPDGGDDHRRLSQLSQYPFLGALFRHHGCLARNAATQTRPNCEHLFDWRKNQRPASLALLRRQIRSNRFFRRSPQRSPQR